MSGGDVQADHPVSGHLDDERLAAFVDGALDGDERAAAELHLAACDACRVAVAEVVRTVEGLEAAEGAGGSTTPVDVGGAVTPRVTGRRGWLYGAAGLAAAAAVVLAVWMPDGERPELRELVEAVGDRRPVEGRLTGGFRYGPLESPARGAEASTDWRVLAAAGRLEEDARGTEDARLLGALGTAHLVTRQFDEAVKYFDQAIDIAPDDVLLRSDRAAALLARGDAAGDDGAADYVRALDDATRAVLKDPTRPEAVFNKAMALQRMHLEDQELEAWRAYLMLDGDSAWATEAQRRVAEIETARKTRSRWEDERDALLRAADAGDSDTVDRIAREMSEQVRLLLEDEVLPQWGGAAAGGDVVLADHLLVRAKNIALSLFTLTGDPFALDAVAAARADQSSATSYRAWGDARKAYLGDQIRASRTQFEAVRSGLPTHNPLGIAADLYVQVARFINGEYDGVSEEFERIADTAARRGFWNLLGTSERMRGLVHGHRGEYTRAIARHDAAARCFERSHELANLSGALSAQAEMSDALGDVRQAWGLRARGFQLTRTRLEGRRAFTSLQGAALAAARSGYWGSAVAFSDAAGTVAGRWGVPGAIVEAYRTQISALLGLSDKAGIERRSAELHHVLDKVSDAHLKARLEVELWQVLGALPWSPRTERMWALDRAVERWAERQSEGRLAEVLLQRARVLEQLGNRDRSEADLRRALSALEHARVPPTDRAAQLERSLTGDLVQLLAASGRGEDALVQFLAGADVQGSARHLARGSVVTRIRSALPPAHGLAAIAVGEKTTVVWLLTSRSLDIRQLPLGLDGLGRAVRRLRRAVGDGDGMAIEREGRQLFTQLLAPHAVGLGRLRRLYVVTDPPLRGIPFSLFHDGRSFLVEHLDLVKVVVSDGPNRRRVASGPVLVVGNGMRHPGLAPLPQAETEARLVAATYPNAEVLVGERATRSAVLNGLRMARIFHFAGHATSGTDHPFTSRLKLAPSKPEDDGWLASLDLVGHMPRLELAVLSGCDTGIDLLAGEPGSTGVALAFLASGVPNVIASLWRVQDHYAARMSQQIHRLVAEGEDPMAALATAQRAAIARGDPGHAWGAFEVVHRF